MIHLKITKKRFGFFEPSELQVASMMPTLRAFLENQLGVNARNIKTPKHMNQTLKDVIASYKTHDAWYNKSEGDLFKARIASDIRNDELHYLDEDEYPTLGVFYYLNMLAHKAFDAYSTNLPSTQIKLEMIQLEPNTTIYTKADRSMMANQAAKLLGLSYEDEGCGTELDESPIYIYIDDMFEDNTWALPNLGTAPDAHKAMIWDIEVLTRRPLTDVLSDWPTTTWQRRRVEQMDAVEHCDYVVWQILTHKHWVPHLRRGGFDTSIS